MPRAIGSKVTARATGSDVDIVIASNSVVDCALALDCTHSRLKNRVHAVAIVDEMRFLVAIEGLESVTRRTSFVHHEN